MTIKDLEPGDVLLFSPMAGSLESEAIVLLTGANVSHAALAWDPATELVEATPPAIREAAAADRFPGRTITVRRLPGNRDMAPVLAAAKPYLEAKEPYPMQDLYLVGMLMLYAKFIPRTVTGRLKIRLFKLLTAGLLDYLNKRKYPGKTPMVCSQFVFQSFQDAGGDYTLRVEGGLLHAAAPAATVTLLDHALAHRPSPSSSLTAPAAEPHPAEEEAVEDMGRELVEALRAAEPEPLAALKALTSPPEPDPEVTSAVHGFAAAVHLAHSGATGGVGDSVAGLDLLAAQRACFVSPADLLRSPSLEDAGTIAMPTPRVPA